MITATEALQKTNTAQTTIYSETMKKLQDGVQEACLTGLRRVFVDELPTAVTQDPVRTLIKNQLKDLGYNGIAISGDDGRISISFGW